MTFLGIRLGVAMMSMLLSSSTPSSTGSRRLNNNNNNNNNGYGNGYNYPGLETCEDLIIQVTSIQTFCDSPQTFYYGSGVHRSSVTCNAGDKATTSVTFDVTENLADTNVYVVLSVYAGYGNDILVSTSPKNLAKYVGYSCGQVGSYSFTYTTTLGSSYSSSYSSSSSNNYYGNFYPYTQIAFSSETNGDYNLGAANIPCNKWEDDHEWTMITAQSTFTAHDFVAEYGILLGTFAVMTLFLLVFVRRLRRNQEANRDKQRSLLLQVHEQQPQKLPPTPV
jgi:hypothetical protein